MNRWRIKLAADAIRKGGVIAYPTEAVFGLGCDPRDAFAVERLFHLKRRPLGQGIILIGASFEQIAPYVEPVSKSLLARVSATWPGPVTWVMRAATETPFWLRGPKSTIAVRVTAHRTAATLCKMFGGAVVSTSANLRGVKPARSAYRIRLSSWSRQLDFVLSGPTDAQLGPSEIRDADSGSVLRPAQSNK